MTIRKGDKGEFIAVDNDMLYVSDSSGLREYELDDIPGQVIEVTSKEADLSDFNTVQLEQFYEQMKEKHPSHEMVSEVKKELDGRYVLFSEAIKGQNKEERDEQEEKKEQPEQKKEDKRVEITHYIRSADGDHTASVSYRGIIDDAGSIVLNSGEAYNRSVIEERQRVELNQSNKDFFEDFSNSQGNPIDADDQHATGIDDVTQTSTPQTLEDYLDRINEPTTYTTIADDEPPERSFKDIRFDTD